MKSNVTKQLKQSNIGKLSGPVSYSIHRHLQSMNLSPDKETEQT